ncbi:hypothetical protein BDV95DRAFT_594817 [Massariosphaeria phaeospora]|uniref:Nucleoporin complex subunit 54-domain-containing protein n=1 Tax=Massariosphaeria phaeospora TaxID=100035 RepID=A0A7C8I641_9PLEO|nr:hypothetical protein BDV95DRAFT_594817 [Massariosphaeria phaeospora]
MAGFGRSNSLSINTGGSLFGSNQGQQQQQQSAGLFGSSTNASQPPTAGLFGATTQSQAGGLFGAGATAGAASQPPQQTTTSLFGATQQPQSSSQPPATGLFGNLSKPAGTAGGLFGSSTAQPPPQQQQQQQSGGLFGGALGGNAQTQTQPQPQTQSGGLFGAQKPLFGASTTGQQTTATPSLFGNANTQQQTQTATPSLFGSTQQTQQPQQQQQNSLFGGGGMNMNSQNPNHSASAQPIQTTALETLKGTTRFNDLHPDIQVQIQAIDDEIQSRITTAHKIREALPQHGDEVATIGPDVAYIEHFLSTIELGLDNDSATIAHQKEVVKKDAADATLSFRSITNLELPAQFHYGHRTTNLGAASKSAPRSAAASLNAADDAADADADPRKPVNLLGYFGRRTDALAATLHGYQAQMREIEAHLRTMEAGTLEKAQQLTGSRSAPRDQRRELVDALRAIEGAILDSAKKVGGVRDAVMRETVGSVGMGVL